MKSAARTSVIAALAAGLAGCNQWANSDPTTFILQCDVTGSETWHGTVTTQAMRQTFRIDLEGKAITEWDAESQTFKTASEMDRDRAQDSVEVTRSQIVRIVQSFRPDGRTTDTTLFDRETGKIRRFIHAYQTSGTEVSTDFAGDCIKVDKPSIENAF